MKKETTNRNSFARFLFVLYTATMLWLLFCRPSGRIEGLTYQQMLQQNTNLHPFYTIGNYLQVVFKGTNPSMLRHCIINLGGNIFLFIPVGFLLPKIWKKMRNFFRFFAVCAGSIFIVEVIQLFTLLGSFDVDDLILNLFGMTIGFLIFTIANALKRQK